VANGEHHSLQGEPATVESDDLSDGDQLHYELVAFEDAVSGIH